MTISLQQISKRFQRHWIFRDISYTFCKGEAYALLGANGSGKSTLLRIISGMQSTSQGKVVYTSESGAEIKQDKIYSQIAYCAPGQEIIDELTLPEMLHFHFTFKKLLPGMTIPRIIALAGLGDTADKPIGDYSSGMRQRVKLAQAIFTDSPILLLDEPCTNLDLAGVEQYKQWMEQYARDRMVIIASNDVREYFFCRDTIVLEDYK